MLGREIVRQLQANSIPVLQAGRTKGSDIFIDLGSGKPPVFATSHNADVLIHCAAALLGDDPAGIKGNYLVNTIGAVDTLDISRQLNVSRIIYAGTVSSDPSIEPDQPLSSYGMSKREGENILDWGMRKAGGTFCSLRLTQLWDTEGACIRHQPWFGRIIAYASRGLTLRMPSSAGPRNFLHVSDAARLLIKAGSSDLTGTHPITSPNDTDMHLFAQKAYEVFNQGGEILIDHSKKPFRKICFSHDDLVFKALGSKPEIESYSGPQLIRDTGTAERFGPLDVI